MAAVAAGRPSGEQFVWSVCRQFVAVTDSEVSGSSTCMDCAVSFRITTVTIPSAAVVDCVLTGCVISK